MARIGSQKLYNTARAGNAPLLQFMLSCPENLSPWNEDKLKQAILGAGDKVNDVLLRVAQVPLRIGTWAQDRLETRIVGEFDATLDTVVMRKRLDDAFALFHGELPTRPPELVNSLFGYATTLGDFDAVDAVLRLVCREDYTESKEDDMCGIMHSLHLDRSWGDRTPKNPALAKRSVQRVLEFGTNERNFTNTYLPLVYKLAGDWKMPDLAAMCFDTRHHTDFIDHKQRQLLAALSPPTRERLMNLQPSVQSSDNE